MSNIVVGGLGGSNLPVYGFGPSSLTSLATIFPNTGSTLGGDSFIIVNSGLSALTYQDTFQGSILNAGRWSNISSGGGSISVNNALNLNVTTSGGTAGIITNSQYNNFDVSTTFTFNSLIEGLFPAQPFTFFYMHAKVDTNNFFSIEFVWDPTRGATVRASITQFGINTVLISTSTTGNGSTFRLVRFGGRILAYAGNTLLVDYNGWRNDLVNIEIATKSTGTALPLSTVVTSYLPQMLITFGSQICPNGGESSGRVLGSTPSQLLPEGVEVMVHSPTMTFTLGTNSFLYTAPLQLTVSSLGGIGVIINNDNTLRDSTATLTGLRL